MPAGFVENFIPVLLNSALTASPICKPFSGGISVQNIPQGPVYPAGFGGYITLGITERTMGQSASQAHAFYRDVAKNRVVWALRDEGGYVASTNSSGQNVMPFWSSISRAVKTKNNVPAYSNMEPDEIDLKDFQSKWLPGLKNDGYLVGLNWSGEDAVGYDADPDLVLKAVELQITSQGDT